MALLGFGKKHPVIERTRRLMERHRQDVAAMDLEVEKSIRYYMSHQHDMYSQGYDPSTPEDIDGEIRYTGNRIAGVTDRKLSKLTAVKPKWVVSSATSERQDMRSAKLSELVLDWAWLVTEMQEKYPHWVWWVLNSPRAWLKITWDPHGGRSAKIPLRNRDVETGEDLGPLVDENGQPLTTTIYEGLPRIDVTDHFSTIIDPLARINETEARYAFHVTVAYCDELEQKYGVRPDPQAVGDTDRYFRQFRVDRIRNLRQPGRDKEEEVCLQIEAWFKPTEEWPEGKRFILAGDEVLLEQDHPYKDKMVPFVGLSERIIGGQARGDWVNRRLFDSQDEWNIRKSHIIEHSDRCANSPFMIPEGADVKHEDIDGMPGGGFLYNETAGQPGYANPGTMSPDVYRDMELTRDDFDRIAEIQTLSQSVSGDASFIALNQRIEEDESTLGVTRGQLTAAFQKAGKMMLSRVHQFVEAPRLVRITGTDHMLSAMRFSKEDIRPDVDVHVTLESSTKLSKTVRNHTIMQLLPLLQETHPEMIPEVARFLEVGGLETIFRRSEEDSAKQQREIERMIQTGQPIGPSEYGNLGAELRFFSSFLKSVEFEMLDPQLQEVLLISYRVKKQAFDQQQQAAALQQIALANASAQVKGITNAGGPISEEPEEEGTVQ